eukprot:gene21831-28858_t
MNATFGPDAVADETGPASSKQEDLKEQNRSKRVPKKNRGGSGRAGNSASGYQVAEPIPISEQQGEFVRVVKVDTRKAALEAGEDPNKVLLSRTGKAALTLSEDRLSVSGTKGFKTARASHGAHVGTYYCEVKVTHLGSTGHVRLGWCTRKAELQAPVGFDEFGYCYRDVEGSKVTRGKREAYGEGYAEGDVIGILVHLPPGGKPMEAQDRNIVRFKGALYYVDEPEPKPEPLIGSFVAFSKNGVSQGVAYKDLLEGTYYPSASLYTLPEQSEGSTVTFNFGPEFAFEPPDIESCPPVKAVSELATVAAESVVPVSFGSTLVEITAAQARKAEEAKTAAAVATASAATAMAVDEQPGHTEPTAPDNGAEQAAA